MSVKIRLTKTGKKNQIQFRIVVQESRTKRDGKFLEILGNFDPKSKKQKIDKDRLNFWVMRGAKPTPSLSFLLENGKLPKRIKKVTLDQKNYEEKTQKDSIETKENQTAEKSDESNTDKPNETEKSAPENQLDTKEAISSTHDQTEQPSQTQANNN